MTDFDRLTAIIRDVLGKPELALGPDDGTETVEGWDSLASVHILTAVSQEFGLALGLDDFDKFGSVRSILDVLEKR